MKNNQGLLVVVVVLLVGILVTLGISEYREAQQPKTIGGHISEAVEEVADEVDDATDAR